MRQLLYSQQCRGPARYSRWCKTVHSGSCGAVHGTSVTMNALSSPHWQISATVLYLVLYLTVLLPPIATIISESACASLKQWNLVSGHGFHIQPQLLHIRVVSSPVGRVVRSVRWPMKRHRSLRPMATEQLSYATPVASSGIVANTFIYLRCLVHISLGDRCACTTLARVKGQSLVGQDLPHRPK